MALLLADGRRIGHGLPVGPEPVNRIDGISTTPCRA